MSEKIQNYIIRLFKNDRTTGTYRVPKEVFTEIKDNVKKYRSYAPISKKVKCIETGQIFESAKAAGEWLIKENKTANHKCDIYIKKACKGKSKSAYNHHWTYV